MENAAKYSPAGTPITVGATTAQDLDGHPAVRIWVVDCGPGIPVFEQSKIFDKFYRVTDTATRTSGTGMGLAIVKGLVDAHQGRVTVHSAHGEGSTFSIVLPIGQDEGGTRESAASLSPSQYRGASS